MPILKITVKACSSSLEVDEKTSVNEHHGHHAAKIKNNRVGSARSRRKASHDIFDGVADDQRISFIRRCSSQVTKQTMSPFHLVFLICICYLSNPPVGY